MTDDLRSTWQVHASEKELMEYTSHFAKTFLRPNVRTYDEDERFQLEAFREAGRLGFHGMTIPVKDGGLGYGAVESTLTMESFAAADAGFALSYLAHSILCTHQIAKHGTEAQKAAWLPGLLSGSLIGSMSLTEPGAGSDALACRTTARASDENWILTGSKTWITNGPICDVSLVSARVEPSLKRCLGSFLVPKSRLRRGRSIQKLGMRTSPTGELFFDSVTLPPESQLSDHTSGIRRLFENLDLERITISGISLGIGRTALEIAQSYARTRIAFQQPIGRFQQIQERISEHATNLRAAAALTLDAARIYDAKDCSMEKRSLMASQAKLFAAQKVTALTLDMIQILGGYGYSREFEVERCLRDAKLIEIGAGTNEILRMIIARHHLGREVTDATRPATPLRIQHADFSM
jgi:isovaleryl-CoA dehydrogenase